jgi:RHS repeat-associated protein
MGYHATASFPSPFATPKTHTPFSRLQERGHRYYSPSLGRWLSRDPIEEQGGQNLYAYAANDPLNGLDARGASCIKFYSWPSKGGPVREITDYHEVGISDSMTLNDLGKFDGWQDDRLDWSKTDPCCIHVTLSIPIKSGLAPTATPGSTYYVTRHSRSRDGSVPSSPLKNRLF